MSTSRAFDRALAAYFHAKQFHYQHAQGFSLTRPEGLWRIRNHPNWPEKDAFYALGSASPSEVVTTITECRPDPGFRLTLFSLDIEGVGAAYERLGFALLAEPPQPFMILDPADAPSISPDALAPVSKDVSCAGAVRDYSLVLEGQVVATVRSTLGPHRSIYVSNMETVERFRRRGFGRRVLCELLQDSSAEGVELAVLCSSPQGLPLYLEVGFEIAAYMVGMERAEDG